MIDTTFAGNDIQILNIDEYPEKYVIRADTSHRGYEIPSCNGCSDDEVRLNGWLEITLRDAPQNGKPVIILVKRRMYACFFCGKCQQQHLDVRVDDKRYTKNLERFIVLLKEEGYCIAAIAREVKQSREMVAKMLKHHKERMGNDS